MPTALIVDDEEDIRFLVRSAIDAFDDGLQVVAEAMNGEEALEQWRSTRPDVVIIDERMPMLGGLDTARRMLAEAPGQLIILFSAFLTTDLRQRAAEAGIRLCLSKDQVFEIPEAVRQLAT